MAPPSMDTLSPALRTRADAQPGLRNRPPLQVLLTVDTEVWPHCRNWRQDALAEDLERDIHGQTRAGAFGLGYQLQLLRTHNLKAIFLVESLFADAVGLKPLRQIVQMIQDSGQDVQLHTHSEWLAWLPESPLPGRLGQNLKNFTAVEQEVLLRRSRDNLRAAGAGKVRSFRAGNFGANLDTLRALSRLGIPFDLSHNYCMPHTCELAGVGPLLQPQSLAGVYEYPMSFFEDYPGHFRHAQLCACSSGEMQKALLAAWSSGWQSFVILSHSFELIKGRKGTDPVPRPNPIVIRRMENLCRFLERHNDKFQTAHSADLHPDEAEQDGELRPLRGSLIATVIRYAEQLAIRVS